MLPNSLFTIHGLLYPVMFAADFFQLFNPHVSPIVLLLLEQVLAQCSSTVPMLLINLLADTFFLMVFAR